MLKSELERQHNELHKRYVELATKRAEPQEVAKWLLDTASALLNGANALIGLLPDEPPTKENADE